MEILRLSNEESNRVTRECLRTAMFKLMNQENFERITITEIAKRAGVSRLAFYRNYESKEALVADLCQHLFEQLRTSLTSERFLTDRRAWYVSFFQTIRENREYFEIYQKANLRLSDGIILEAVYPVSSTEEHYTRAASEGAFLSVLTEWFRSGMQESPEEMAAICEKVIASPAGTYTAEKQA
ncbi:MAG: TetR/AcrR family transcriptional regulator [Oscillospiraceae bacterium]|nr:TetR/AcrR family transcriptional regulator [Oscillospiraceae bacterium]